ncbi:acyltransferase family protein [Pseudarthrobacter oxydans]|uniref:acyltransferase family protein n=1 Tax=Pseudarthrobacter oxydans TaxID=1671 RepID=UPI00344DFEC0
MTTDVFARPKTASRIRSLDGVRAVAVLVVLAYHAHLPFFVGGYAGVDVFFVLSGYLITTILLRELHQRGTINLWIFYLKRALRLLPALAVVCIAVALAWSLISWVPVRSETLWGVPAAFLYLSSWTRAFEVNSLGYMGHTWSLSVEEHFYLVWPLLLLALFKFTRNPRHSIIIVAAMAVTYRIASPLMFGHDRIYNGSDTQAAQLLIGCAVAAVLYGSSQKVGVGLGLMSTLTLLAIVAFVPLHSTAYLYGGSLITALAAATLTAHLVTDSEGPLVRLLSLKPFLWVGARSYGIYLWHYPVFGLLSASALPAVAAIGLSVILSFVIPSLSYKYVEQPFLNRKDRLHSPG